MKIGIVSNSKICMPLLSYLSNYNKAGVMLYLGKSLQPGIAANDIIVFCRSKAINIYTESNQEELYQWQQVYSPDVIFFLGYSNKVDIEQLSGVPKGIYNIHFGKLPQFRGPSPVFWQIKKGEASIGLAIHQMTDKLDSGPVVWEHNINNEEYHTYSYINEVFSELQVRGVLDILEKIAKNQVLSKKIQDKTEAKYYSKPKFADVMINWEKMDVKEILSLIKACSSWNNGAAALINGYELKILDAEQATEKQPNSTPGAIIIGNSNFNVICIDNEVLSINFFNINSTCIPARHAGFYGLQTGQKFISRL
ncbi:formyltransferase family protein [Mucilaginibacter dorajii]|uniref:Methionyl-tRNA formyltransferase n=1 Tax=Mucilaginibacter dorajii TaxID=692994 RepID=A0ABP7QWA3_9SPHI|nr:formyltransferase family protein [Mucilaginibacter dorajii]MCS3732493.1 methionyl-tRNA formyltransferase [Mucilaginibacter dorajii]